jgi:gluconokinase
VFFGITAQHTQAHFSRAVVEGISLALYHIGQTLEESGVTINQINVSGGFVHTAAWLQLLADIFGKPIGLVSQEDASAIGAAYLGLKNLGLIKNYQVLKPKNIHTFIPVTENHRIYSTQIFPLFRNLTRNLMLDMTVRHEMQSASF